MRFDGLLLCSATGGIIDAVQSVATVGSAMWCGPQRVVCCVGTHSGGEDSCLHFQPHHLAQTFSPAKVRRVSRSATAGQWSPMVATEHQRGASKPSFQLYPSVEEAAQPLLAPYINRCSSFMACTRFCTTVELMSGCWPLLGCCLRSRLFASPPEGLPSGRLGDATKVCRRPQPSNSTPLASRILVLMEPFAPCRSLCAHGDSEWRLRVDAARGRGSGGRHLRC